MVAAYFVWRELWADRYELVGSTSVGSGRAHGKVDLAAATHAYAYQEIGGRDERRRELYLSIEDPLGQLIIKIGTNVTLLRISARSLRIIAEHLDTAPAAPAHDVAGWLRKYAGLAHLRLLARDPRLAAGRPTAVPATAPDRPEWT